MNIFRQYIAPLLIVLVFLVALVAVSSRIFMPFDMAAPAPVDENSPNAQMTMPGTVADLPPSLSVLVRGAADDIAGMPAL